MKPHPRKLLLAACGTLLLAPFAARASSHMDAPLITLDPAANTTDVYAFVTQVGAVKYLTCALAVYPFEEPGIGPNKYNFDDKVVYSINLATGANLAAGKPTMSFEFRFRTLYKTQETIAQSYLPPGIETVDDGSQNLTQHYMVQKVVGEKTTTLLADGIVPPNNQGRVTRHYNQGENGDNLAKEGVAPGGTALDVYTLSTIFSTPQGYKIFAGQRDDGFYADIQSIFDLDFTFSGPNKPFDSQAGFNVHTMVISIPITEFPAPGAAQNVGVWATTSRSQVFVLRNPGTKSVGAQSRRVQVGRQGNPLFCEALVSIVDKDRYNRSTPTKDKAEFEKYALAPELATLLGAQMGRRINRTDLAGIFIPDLIKVDLSTPAARLAGGTNSGAAPDDTGFSRLGIFGGDKLLSTINAGLFNDHMVPGGWPNGRRFGDDVVDIAVNAILNDLRTSPPTLDTVISNVDKVTSNDIGYNKVFPYAATPQNGRNHAHP